MSAFDLGLDAPPPPPMRSLVLDLLDLTVVVLAAPPRPPPPPPMRSTFDLELLRLMASVWASFAPEQNRKDLALLAL